MRASLLHQCSSFFRMLIFSTNTLLVPQPSLFCPSFSQSPARPIWICFRSTISSKKSIPSISSPHILLNRTKENPNQSQRERRNQFEEPETVRHRHTCSKAPISGCLSSCSWWLEPVFESHPNVFCSRCCILSNQLVIVNRQASNYISIFFRQVYVLCVLPAPELSPYTSLRKIFSLRQVTAASNADPSCSESRIYQHLCLLPLQIPWLR